MGTKVQPFQGPNATVETRHENGRGVMNRNPGREVPEPGWSRRALRSNRRSEVSRRERVRQTSQQNYT